LRACLLVEMIAGVAKADDGGSTMSTVHPKSAAESMLMSINSLMG
jgi:hypothetical protein